MKKLLILALVAAMAGGCGFTFEFYPAARTARDKCLDAGHTHDDIDSLFIAARFDRENGRTQSGLSRDVVPFCQAIDRLNSKSCINCALAILNEVFAE